MIQFTINTDGTSDLTIPGRTDIRLTAEQTTGLLRAVSRHTISYAEFALAAMAARTARVARGET